MLCSGEDACARGDGAAEDATAGKLRGARAAAHRVQADVDTIRAAADQEQGKVQGAATRLSAMKILQIFAYLMRCPTDSAFDITCLPTLVIY